MHDYKHPAMIEADEATAHPKHPLLWAIAIVALTIFVSSLFPLGFAA